MKPFGYVVAPDPAAAVAMVTERPGAAFLGGGTNLVDLMKLGVAAPDLLVDVTGCCPAGSSGQCSGMGRWVGWLRIGAGVRNSDLAADPRVRAEFPVLAQAVLAGASGQLRNMATVGGNLLQRTRCLYFQDVTKPCNKRMPGSGCPARAGEHRNLAILGGSPHCVATHPSDMAVALAALDAVVHVEGAAGPRAIPLGGLYRLPGDEPDRETTLERGDLITAVEVPALGYAGNSAYRKVRDRASYAFGVASVAAALDVAGGVVQDVRIAFGAVAPMPWRARLAEQVLVGQPATAEWFGRAADAELAAAVPLRDNAFKVTLVAQHRGPDALRAGRGLSGRHRVTGRVDGPDKVTGRARYAFEHPVDGAAYVWAVPSVIAKGLIRSVDASAALALPGVLAVITPDNAPRLAGTGDPELALFQSRAVAYRGQFVAAVVADTLETAREAAGQVRIEYQQAAHDVTLTQAILDCTSRTTSTRATRPIPRSATSTARSPPPRSASTRPTGLPPSTTTRWSRTPPSRRGRGTR